MCARLDSIPQLIRSARTETNSGMKSVAESVMSNWFFSTFSTVKGIRLAVMPASQTHRKSPEDDRWSALILMAHSIQPYTMKWSHCPDNVFDMLDLKPHTCGHCGVDSSRWGGGILTLNSQLWMENQLLLSGRGQSETIYFAQMIFCHII